MWNDPAIDKTVELMDPQTKYECQKLAEKLIKPKTEKQREIMNQVKIQDVDRFEAAAQLRLMIRDGLPVCMLTKEEYALMSSIYGEEYLSKLEEKEIITVEDVKAKIRTDSGI